MTDIPQALARFEILRILGKGGMGTVYLARDQRLGRQVAIKVLNTEDVLTDDSQARFLREARTAAAIRHQNVATIYEVDETEEGQPFIVMEYCEGETLSQRMRRRPADTAELLAISRQLAAGLAAAHEQGVIHRDIKAANIIIEQNGVVKILDFGLAKLLGRELGSQAKASALSSSGQFFGTLHYLAPEQARGGPADARSDLFAIGVLMYQMAAGRLPFEADVALMVLEKIRDAEPAPLVPIDPSFPPDLAHFIGNLLQKDPQDRYQSARDLLRDLEHIEAPTLRVPGHHTRSMLGRTVRRPKTLRIAIAVAAFLMVGVTVVVVRRGTSSSPPLTSTAIPTTPIKSLAVLPLNNTARTGQDDFFSVGLADALVTKLQGIPSLQVRPTSAVMELREKTDARTAGEKLHVDGVLEGQFLAAGNLVRVTLQLTDTRSGYSVWADSVDGKRDNLLKLIDDVSARTMTALNDKLGMKPAESRHSEPRSSNPAAYEHYLKARSMTGSFVESDYNAQLDELRRAIKLDPGFAAAYADLAIALSLGTARSLSSGPETIESAEPCARQAVRLSESSASSSRSGPGFRSATGALSRVSSRSARRAPSECERYARSQLRSHLFRVDRRHSQGGVRRRADPPSRSVIQRGENPRLLVRERR